MHCTSLNIFPNISLHKNGFIKIIFQQDCRKTSLHIKINLSPKLYVFFFFCAHHALVHALTRMQAGIRTTLWSRHRMNWVTLHWCPCCGLIMDRQHPIKIVIFTYLCIESLSLHEKRVIKVESQFPHYILFSKTVGQLFHYSLHCCIIATVTDDANQ